MKATNEIGTANTVKFILFAIAEIIYHQLINHLFFLPPARKLFLIILGAKIGPSTIVMNVKFFNWHRGGPSGLTVGKECFIGDETLIDLYDRVTLQDQVTIAQRVTILTHLNVGYQDHPLQKIFPKKHEPVILERGAVIGAASTILPGVRVGRESFVAAGSVVTKNVPPRTLVGGVPATPIRKWQRSL